MSRSEGEVTRALVSLASSLTTGADVVDLLSELTEVCAALLDVASAGLHHQRPDQRRPELLVNSAGIRNSPRRSFKAGAIGRVSCLSDTPQGHSI